jgi:hypothetical protein
MEVFRELLKQLHIPVSAISTGTWRECALHIRQRSPLRLGLYSSSLQEYSAVVMATAKTEGPAAEELPQPRG